jgi:2-polyprenyl-6-methoxyphenol hydroxylase-like FAD-dependent oxidoreductase
MSKLKILISGTSIAGPSTAYWLSLAGHNITLIERFPSLRTGGQAIDIRTFGVTIMRRVPGLEARIRTHRVREEGICIVDANGASYGEMRASGDPERQGLVSEYEVLRGDLSRVLVELTRGKGKGKEKDGKEEGNEVKYIFNEQIAGMEQLGSGVKVAFKNGMPEHTYDLVIACDGAMSRTRALAFDCDVRDNVVPSGSWAAYFSLPSLPAPSATLGVGHSAPGGRSVSIGSDPATGGSRVMLMCVNQTRDELEAFRAALAASTLSEYLESKFADVGWVCPRILELLPQAQDLYASEIVQVKPPALYRGRVVLVGDAGYAAGPTGGGTSLALAGGYFLAGELAAHPGDIEAALKGYEEQMRPLITEMQKIPPLVGTFMAPRTRWGIVVRNWLFWVVVKSGIVGWVERWLAPAFGSSEEYKVKEYMWAKNGR